MNLANVIVLAIGLSMDAFAVSLTNGMLQNKIRLQNALTIAISFGFFQALMPVIGFYAGKSFSTNIHSIGPWIAFSLLFLIGGKMIYEGLKKHDPDQDDQPNKVVTFRMLLGMSIATSIDALAVGVSLALLESDILLPSLLIGSITFVICFAGVYIGKHFGKRFIKHPEILGGIVLIAIAIKILVEGLVF